MMSIGGGVRHGVAKNPNTSPETLALLANDEAYNVRSYVAYNPNTSSETLERLANDDYYGIHVAVTKNPNTPQYIKDYLKIKEFLNYYV